MFEEIVVVDLVGDRNSRGGKKWMDSGKILGEKVKSIC